MRDHGAALIGLGRCDEAEKRLLEAYGLFLEARIPDRGNTNKAVQWLITLYEAWNKPDEAARFRSLLAATSESQPKE